MYKNRIKELRNLKGVSLRQLSQETGLDWSTICAIENGRRKLNMRFAEKLSEYFGVSIDFLLGKDIDSQINEFMTNLLKVYNQYEDGSNSRSSSLAYIMKAVYEMDEATLQEAVNYIRYLSAKSDFK